MIGFRCYRRHRRCGGGKAMPAGATVLARGVALLLAAALAFGGEAPQSARVREKVAALPPGTRVHVTLVNNKTVRGTLQNMDDGGFTVVTLKNPAERRFRFEEVRGVRRPSRIPMAAWIGIVAGGGLLIFAIWFHQVDKRT